MPSAGAKPDLSRLCLSRPGSGSGSGLAQAWLRLRPGSGSGPGLAQAWLRLSPAAMAWPRACSAEAGSALRGLLPALQTCRQPLLLLLPEILSFLSHPAAAPLRTLSWPSQKQWGGAGLGSAGCYALMAFPQAQSATLGKGHTGMQLHFPLQPPLNRENVSKSHTEHCWRRP